MTTSTNYKLNITSLEYVDPKAFTNTYAATNISTVNHYLFEMLSNDTQTVKQYGETKKIYHSQTLLTFDSTSDNIEFPLWELALNANKSANIGKIMLNINYLTDNDDQSSKTEMLQLIGTTQALTPLSTTSLTTTSTTTVLSTTSKLGGSPIEFPFYVKGRKVNDTTPGSTVIKTSDTIRHSIELNNWLKGLTTDGGYVALGVKVNEAPTSQIKIKFDTYVEVIE